MIPCRHRNHHQRLRLRYCSILSRFRSCDYSRSMDWISNYNTVADFHTTNHSTLTSHSALTSRCLVTALNNGYSSAVVSLDVSWKRILTMEIPQLPWSHHYCPAIIPQLNSSQSHIATDGQSVSKSWCRPDIYYCLTVMVLCFVGALSDERKGLSFVYAAGPC
jgi:hypothetical protein